MKEIASEATQYNSLPSKFKFFIIGLPSPLVGFVVTVTSIVTFVPIILINSIWVSPQDEEDGVNGSVLTLIEPKRSPVVVVIVVLPSLIKLHCEFIVCEI